MQYIRISHQTAKDGLLQFEFGQDIDFFLQRASVKKNVDRNVLRFMVNSVFQDEYETLFISSGRSRIQWMRDPIMRSWIKCWSSYMGS